MDRPDRRHRRRHERQPHLCRRRGVDKLVGALSYGDAFTLGGLGLATPIEYMAAIESDYAVGALAALQAPRPPAPGAYPLDEPVKTSAGVLRSVVVARSATAAASVQAASGQTVMTPLGILEIGGAKPGSKAFERVAARFEKTGLLIKAASGDGRWAGAPTPDLAGGSPCAILFSQGAVWVGAAGTVTYVDGESVMLFGHPFEQLGAIDAILTGGDVQGVWASSYTPYKLIAPRDVKGACVQDRNWGVQARLGQVPDLFPVATTVTIADRAVTVTDDSEVSEWLVTANAYPGLPGDIVAQVVWNAVDQYSYPGSATTMTTVVASDRTGTYTIQHENLWSNSWDVSYDAGSDAYTILSALAADPDGVIHPRVESVDVAATVSPTQRTARIAAVTLPDGIGVGDTTVRIEYYRYGSAELQTVDAILVIPAGTPLYGRLVVQPASWEGEEWDDGSAVDSTPPRTLAELADELNGTPMNSDLIVSYLPGGDEGDEGEPSAAASIAATIPTDYVFNSYYSASTARVMIEAQPRRVAYGGAVQVTGFVDASSETTVDIYRRYADSDTAVRVATTTATPVDGMASFAAVVPGLKKNATLVARTHPIDGTLPGSASVSVKVVAKVWLSGSSRLAIHVRPGEADGTARLQKKRGGVWTAYKTVKITDGEGFTALPRGTHVLRARFSGSPLCTPGTSRAYTITVR